MFIDVEDAVDKINDNLPPQIRVLGKYYTIIHLG